VKVVRVNCEKYDLTFPDSEHGSASDTLYHFLSRKSKVKRRPPADDHTHALSRGELPPCFLLTKVAPLPPFVSPNCNISTTTDKKI